MEWQLCRMLEQILPVQISAIKSLSNVAGFEKDTGASNGIIKKFKGSNSNYKVLKEIFNISGGNVELITKLMLNSQNIYS